MYDTNFSSFIQRIMLLGTTRSFKGCVICKWKKEMAALRTVLCRWLRKNIFRSATGGGALGVRAPSCITHFGLGHVSFHTWTKTMHISFFLLLIYLRPPLKITKLRLWINSRRKYFDHAIMTLSLSLLFQVIASLLEFWKMYV